MKNEYEIKKLKSWLENINLANNTLADIEDEYCGGIDYEDGEHEFTRSDMDDLFRLLSNLEEALKKLSLNGLFFFVFIREINILLYDRETKIIY